MNQQSELTCYLCGKPVGSEDRSGDHILTKQAITTSIRAQIGLTDFISATHRNCNHGYQHDEEYFVNSLGQMTGRAEVSEALLADLVKQLKRPEGRRLIEKIRNEVSDHHGDLKVPEGKVAKQIEGQRIWRIAWKIVRGFYFRE